MLLAWGTALHQPLAGHVTFFETNRLTARETVGFAAGECVGYEETFVSGKGADGAYVCRLAVAAEKLELMPGGPSRAFVPAAAREYATPVAAALLAENSKSRELPSSMASKPALFRDSTWGVEPASPELVKKISERRRVVIAQPGSDDLAYQDSPFVMAEANCNDHDYQHILIRENPSKAALLEEFLHGTQQRLGLIGKLGRGGAERHVKDFMIRHQKILGLGTEDVEILNVLIERRLINSRAMKQQIRMEVKEIFTLSDGKSIFVGPIVGEPNLIRPSRWKITINNTDYLTINITGEQIMTRRSSDSNFRAISTYTSLNKNELSTANQLIELLPIE